MRNYIEKCMLEVLIKYIFKFCYSRNFYLLQKGVIFLLE